MPEGMFTPFPTRKGGSQPPLPVGEGLGVGSVPSPKGRGDLLLCAPRTREGVSVPSGTFAGMRSVVYSSFSRGTHS